MRGMDGFETLTAWASRRGEPLGVAVRHHLLEGLLRRLARLPCAGELVLRGGLMTRAWVAPRVRPTRDLDLVGDFPFDLAETTRRFRGVLDEQVEDGLELDPARFGAQGIWLDTDFPGVRVTLGARLWGSAPEELTVDIGFGDPLVPEAGWLDYPALQPLPAARVRACCPETMAAWKLHGLAERGASWRPQPSRRPSSAAPSRCSRRPTRCSCPTGAPSPLACAGPRTAAAFPSSGSCWTSCGRRWPLR
jgi:hypothetical protein